jgi:putative endonuclease
MDCWQLPGVRRGPYNDVVPMPSPRSQASLERAGRRWYVYLILCRGDAIYTGIALDVMARYAQHVAGTGARYTRANPPHRLLARFSCPSQSVAARLEAAIKRLSAAEKLKLVGTSGAAARKRLLTRDGPIQERNKGN